MDSIPHVKRDGLKVITRQTLALIAPEALSCRVTSNVGPLEEEDLDVIWYMDQRPVLQHVTEDEYRDETWSETNEPELAAWLAEEWDRYAVPFGDVKVLILCGTHDDEYGNVWSHTEKVWHNYAF